MSDVSSDCSEGQVSFALGSSTVQGVNFAHSCGSTSLINAPKCSSSLHPFFRQSNSAQQVLPPLGKAALKLTSERSIGKSLPEALSGNVNSFSLLNPFFLLHLNSKLPDSRRHSDSAVASSSATTVLATSLLSCSAQARENSSQNRNPGEAAERKLCELDLHMHPIQLLTQKPQYCQACVAQLLRSRADFKHTAIVSPHSLPPCICNKPTAACPLPLLARRRTSADISDLSLLHESLHHIISRKTSVSFLRALKPTERGSYQPSCSRGEAAVHAVPKQQEKGYCGSSVQSEKAKPMPPAAQNSRGTAAIENRRSNMVG